MRSGDNVWVSCIDVLGILKMQAGLLDRAHMTELARGSGLAELLGRAMRDAGQLA